MLWSIIYKLQSFNNYKNAKKKNILTSLDAEKQIDEIVYKTEKLLKVKYENRLDDTNTVIVYSEGNLI